MIYSYTTQTYLLPAAGGIILKFGQILCLYNLLISKNVLFEILGRGLLPSSQQGGPRVKCDGTYAPKYPVVGGQKPWVQSDLWVRSD